MESDTDSVRAEAGTSKTPDGPFPASSYEAQGLDQLVTYCVSRILRNGEECTFERLTYECFTLFPRKFGLERYPQWPDSARINKSWLRCRTDKKWIAGTVKAGFTLTPAGNKVAESTAASLGEPARRSPARQTAARERWRAILNHVRRHRAFMTYVHGQGKSCLSIDDVRDVLMTTGATPMRAVKKNLAYFKQVAEAYRDSDVAGFLEACARVLRSAEKNRAGS